MKQWAEMATDIWVAVMGALALGGDPFIAVTDDGIAFGIDLSRTNQSPGYSLN